jgi:WD40 repeat protein
MNDIRARAVSPDLRFSAIGTSAAEVYLLQADTGAWKLAATHRAAVNAVDFLGPDQLISASEDGRILVTHTSGAALASWTTAESVIGLEVHSAENTIVAILDSSRRLTLRLEEWDEDDSIQMKSELPSNEK